MNMTCLSYKYQRARNSLFITGETQDLAECLYFRKQSQWIKSRRINTQATTLLIPTKMTRIMEATTPPWSSLFKKAQNKEFYLTRCRWPVSLQYSLPMRKKRSKKKMRIMALIPLTELQTLLKTTPMRVKSSIRRTSCTPTRLPPTPNLDTLLTLILLLISYHSPLPEQCQKLFINGVSCGRRPATCLLLSCVLLFLQQPLASSDTLLLSLNHLAKLPGLLSALNFSRSRWALTKR